LVNHLRVFYADNPMSIVPILHIRASEKGDYLPNTLTTVKYNNHTLKAGCQKSKRLSTLATQTSLSRVMI